MRLLLRTLLVLAAWVVLSIPMTDAVACGNATMAEVDTNVKKMKAAEAALEKGELANAKKTAREVRMFLSQAERVVHEGNRTEDLRPLLRRAIRTEALATYRDAKSTATERSDTLKMFEAYVLTQPATPSGSTDSGPKDEAPKPDPTILADHAEILSRIPSRTGPALMVLRTLRDKDLLGSAHAFAALARLEAAAGKADAEKEAREKCRKAAVKPAICEE